MRILIVNGYSNTPKGKESFAKFQELVQEIFLTQKDASDIQYEFVIRGKSDLDDFLYELDSAYSFKQGALSFDHVDIVFIDGDVNLLPWSPACAKILILLRMCLRAKKTMFATAFAMQALVFLTATNAERQINVVNGKGKGGKIGDILKFGPNLSEVRSDGYFLDNVTGDLYAYHPEKNEWVPKMNVGIHYARAAESFDSLGKFIIKTPTYKPKTQGDHSLTYISKDIEDICTIKKAYLMHWVFHDVQREFKIPARNSWHIHQFNFVNPQKTFVVLADSSKCPQIIYFESFCIGTLFSISKKYSQTIKILENFIVTKVKELKAHGKENFISIESASAQMRGKLDFYDFRRVITESDVKEKAASMVRNRKLSQRSSSIRILRNSNSNGRASRSSNFHSGLAITNHDGPPLLVENNAVRNDFTIKILDDKKEEKPFKSFFQTPQGSNEIQFINTRANSVGKYHSQSRVGTAQPKVEIKKDPEEAMSREWGRDNSFSHYLDNNNTNKAHPLSKVFTQGILKNTNIERNTSEINLRRSKADIMLMLYPDISREALETPEVWVPGQLSASKLEGSSVKGKKKVRVDRSTLSGFYSTFSKFKDLDLDAGRATPCIRTGDQYISQEEKLRREEKIASLKNVGPNYFKFAGKATKPFIISNYVTQTPSDPPANYKFREEIRRKWLGGSIKL